MQTNQRKPRRQFLSPVEMLENRRLFAVAYNLTDLTPNTVGAPHSGEAYGISNNGKIALSYDGHAAYWAEGVVHDLGFAGRSTDINDSGVVCGVDTSTGTARPFVWNAGVKTILSLDGQTLGGANAINNAGTVVGDIQGTDGDFDAFAAPLGGAAHNIGGPAGYDDIEATGINDSGQIIGNAFSNTTGRRAFIRSNDVFTLYPTLPGGSPTGSTAHGITNSGTAALYGGSADFYVDGPTRIYHVYTVGSNGFGPISDKGAPANTYDIQANDINAGGQIASTVIGGIFPQVAYVYRDGAFHSLTDEINPALGWSLFSANAVNDSGRIVGFGYNADGDNHAYLLTPIAAPPPPTFMVSGKLWNDSDSDGVFDPNESTSGVRTVYIDANANGQLDAGEKQTQSNVNGEYSFTGLANGAYKVTRVFPAGYHLSNGPAGYVPVTVSGANKTGVNLGTTTNAPALGSITGVLWNDTDRDGIFDANESPSGVRTVFIDTDGDKILDAGERSVQSNAEGRYTFNNLAAGTYKVTRVFPAGYRLSNNNAGYVTVSLASGQAKVGVNLGTRIIV